MISEKVLKKAAELIKKGHSRENVVTELGEEAFLIASARAKASKKFSRQARMFLTPDDLRFATPELVAKYRAKRLRCMCVADLCSGISGQTIFLARQCRNVIAVEQDNRKLEYAKMNAKAYGVSNIEFLQGDVLDDKIIKRLKGCELAFCDPSRPAEENERNLKNLTPTISELAAYDFKGIAFEAPPQLSPEKINADCEREYISVNGKLNRLTLYTGSLKRCEISVVSLPCAERLEAAQAEPLAIRSATKACRYLYEVDTAIVKAGLIGNLVNGMQGMFLLQSGKRTLLTSEKIHNSTFLKAYEVLAETDNDIKSINAALIKLNAGKAVLRASVEPGEYWNLRSRIEQNLKGKESLCVFIGARAIVCRPIGKTL